MKVLIPGHFHEELAARTGRAAELVPYDAHGLPEGDSAGAEALFRWWLSPEEGDRLILDHPDLRWIHSGSAGIDHILTSTFRGSSLLLTNSSGVHAPSIAEWVVGAMIAAVKDFRSMDRRQRERTFEKVQRPELAGQQALFLGAGQIASEIAKRLTPFGMRLVALRKSGAPHPLFSMTERPERLAELAPEADWLIVTAPLTRETEGIVSKKIIDALPGRARVVNVSRGELVDERALVEALRAKQIAGAILDVFETEPLPAEHALWELENAILFPHTTWRSTEIRERQLALFLENLSRFIAGRKLRNVVDVERGY